MSSLSVICAVMSSPVLRLVFSLSTVTLFDDHEDELQSSSGSFLVCLLLYSVSHLPAFAGTNFIIRQRTHLFHSLQGKTSPGSQLRKAEKTFFVDMFFLFLLLDGPTLKETCLFLIKTHSEHF